MKNTKESLNSGEAQQQPEVVPQDYISRRAAELREKSQKDEVQPPALFEEEVEDSVESEAEEQEAAEEAEEVEESTDDSEQEENVLSQIDYEQLDEDQAEELGRQLTKMLGDNVAAFSKGLGGKLGPEMGKLRGELRAIKEENQKLKSGFEKVNPNSNQFSHITDIEELATTEQKLVQLYDYYEDIAISGNWETDDFGEEGIYDKDKFYPKSKMLDFLKQWKSELRAIPDRKQQLNKRKSLKADRDKLAKSLADKIDWFSDKESEHSKQYSEMLNDPAVVGAIQIFPELEPVLMEAMAYTVEGRNSKKRKAVKLPLKSKSKPTGGMDSGAGSNRSQSRALKEVDKRIKQGSFSPNDWSVANASKYKSFFNK